MALFQSFEPLNETIVAHVLTSMSTCRADERNAGHRCKRRRYTYLSRRIVELVRKTRDLKPVSKYLPAVSAAATAAAMSAAAAVFSRRHRARFGDGHVSTAVFSSVEFLNRVRGFLIAGHLNETESLASTGIAIRDDLG